MRPIARFENIVVQELRDETLICDLVSNRVFCLNHTASEVWKQCDGKTEVSEISQKLSRKMKKRVDNELVCFALGELASENLLTEKIPSKLAFSGFSRREAIKRIGLSSMVALPLISSVMMPKAIHAQSGGCNPAPPLQSGCNGCSQASDCQSGCCNLDNFTCQPDNSGTCPNGSSCTFDSDCDSECCSSGACADFEICNPPPDCTANPGAPGCPCNIGSDCDSGCCSGQGGVCASGC